MLTTYQNIITCHQLHDLLYPTATSCLNVDSDKPSNKVIILDASIPPVGKMQQPEKQWPEFTLPYAQRFDLNKNFSDLSNPLPHTMPNAEHFQQQAQVLGIDNDSQIIVYDDQGLFSAARAWYMFKAMGHKHVAVLDGGLPEWLKLGFPVCSAMPSKLKQGNFSATLSSDYFCNSQYICEQYILTDSLIVDARASDRFAGKVAEPRQGMRRGHIPNSVNLPFSDLLSDGLLLPKKSLQEKFKIINNQGTPMIMSCGSGVTACVLILAAEICGFKHLKVYDGSWSEWGADHHFPVTTAS